MNPFKVMRMRPAKSTKFQAITSGASFVTPADWNNANNKVHCIGAGANGLVGSGSGGNAFGKQGGGGGAYAAKNNMTLSALSSARSARPTAGRIRSSPTRPR